MTFDPVEEIYRLAVFEKNLILINKHNSDPTRTYDMGINMFTHLTNNEFIHKYLTTAKKGKESIRTENEPTQKM